MASVGSKLREGDKLVAEAEKCLKTSWLKWSPDYDNAAHAFDKAALCYRSAKAYDKARDTYERAADTYYKNHATFHSGKALEQAANVCRDMKALEQAAGFLERASAMFHESGYGDTAGQVLTKAAKLVDQVNPRKAAGYFLATAELHEIEEKYRDSATATRNAVNMFARARDYDKILETLQKLRQLYIQLQQHKHLYEVASVEIVAHLHNDDSVAASDAYNVACRVPGFMDSDEAPVLDRLIEAYRERDSEAMQECCNNVVFRSMDNEIAKLARDLRGKFELGGSPLGASGSRFSDVMKPRETKLQPKAEPSRKPVQPVSDMRAELFGGSSGRGERSRPMKTRIEESEEEQRELFRADEEVGSGDQKQLGEEVGQEGGENDEVGGGGDGEVSGDAEAGEDGDEDAYGGMLR